MINSDLNNYMKAMNSRREGIKKVELISSKRKQAWKRQGGKCIKCKKDLKAYLCKYVEDSGTKEVSVVCSDCAIKVASKRR